MLPFENVVCVLFGGRRLASAITTLKRASTDKNSPCAAGTTAAEYFDLVEELVADAAAAAHLVAHNMLTSLMHHIKLHAAMLLQAEYGCSLNILGPCNTSNDQTRAASIANIPAR